MHLRARKCAILSFWRCVFHLRKHELHCTCVSVCWPRGCRISAQFVSLTCLPMILLLCVISARVAPHPYLCFGATVHLRKVSTAVASLCLAVFAYSLLRGHTYGKILVPHLSIMHVCQQRIAILCNFQTYDAVQNHRLRTR